jgi:GAF domain-containing protein
VHYLTGTDVLPMSVPAELTHCSVVVAQDSALVVPDSRVDDRFRDNPFTDVTHAVFYAGHPIRSSTGETIGAFCVIGGWAKPETAVPLDELRDFALRAEAEVQRLEHAGAAAG